MYGNYFSVDTRALPMMTNDFDYVDTQVSSDSDVFGISASWSVRHLTEQLMSYDYTRFNAVVENIALRDNDSNSNNEAENAHHMRGLNCFDVHHINVTFDNVIIEAYTISLVPSNSNMKMTVKNCQLNNAWQNHIFAWTHNKLQCDAEYYVGPSVLEQDPWENTKPIEVVIENSTLTKCGGPVIMAMTGSSEPYNKTAGLNVSVDASSELWSYVTGNEAWFTAYESYGAKTYASTLKALSGAISNTATTKYSASASLTTTLPGSGSEQFMNMVFASLSGNAKYTVAGTVLMDNTETVVSNHKNHPMFSAAPLMQSTVDNTATATWLGAEGEGMGLSQQMVWNATNPAEDIDADFFAGDLFNFHFPSVGISVVMGYFHAAE